MVTNMDKGSLNTFVFHLIKRHDAAPYGARMAWVAGCDDKESERWGWDTLRITKTQLLGNAYF